MGKTAVVYWSGTGNTEQMAQAVAAGAIGAGQQVDLFEASQFDTGTIGFYDSLAFGCPSMGAEQLEEQEFEPMFDNCRDHLQGKRIALFGSYGWGDGQWMRNWEKDCVDLGAVLVCDCVICNEAPEDDAISQCKALGSALA